jgi:hypothetical protein
VCSNPNRNSCWVLEAPQDTIDTVFIHMWEFTYSVRTFFNLIEVAYTVIEERAIYLRLKREGLLDNW